MCAIYPKWRKHYFFLFLAGLIGFLTYLQWTCLISQNKYSLSDRLRYGESIIPGWEPYKVMLSEVYVQPLKDLSVFIGSNVCNPKSLPEVLFIVCSEPKNYDQRVAIRNTWAIESFQNYSISVVFFLGMAEEHETNSRVVIENQIYNDMVVENFVDTPMNATIKSVMMLKWVNNKCNSVKWVMKSTDDVYINLTNLNEFVRNPEHPNQDALYGALKSKEFVEHDSNMERFMPKYMYPYNVYPDYLSGVGYLMSIDVVKKLYEAALRSSVIYLEDVFITGICAESANIKRKYDFRFYYIEGSNRGFDCSILYQRNLIIHSHNVNAFQMYENYDIAKLCP